MCIAVWKNAGVKMPKKEVLRKCFTTNSQGAGFAHYDKDLEVWKAQKGFMSWKKFWSALRFMQYQKEDAVIMHFRISTSGKRTHPDCTHPFPVSFDVDKLNAHTFESETIVMHNGVVGPGDGDLSDTQVAIMQHVAPLFPFINERGVEEILGDLLKDDRCRWFIANKTDISMYGEWHDGEEHAPGVLFSNKGFIPYTPPATVHNHRAVQVWNRNSNQRHVTPNPFHQTPGIGIHRTETSSPGVKPEVWKNTILVNLGDDEHKDDFVAENGGWDWAKWDDDSRFHESKGNQKTDTKKLLTKAPSLVEVFNLTGDLEAVVDENGDIIWAEDEWTDIPDNSLTYELGFELKRKIVEEGVDWEFECPCCGNMVTVRKLSYNGECCFCYAEIMSFEDLDWVEAGKDSAGFECPECHESKRLVDSPFNIGDTLCETCGAIFIDKDMSIVMYDEDINRTYKIAKNVMGA